jgi:ribosomal-protein-alanine N-acetyltransferase
MTTVELRALGLTDLRAIEEIERRSYPTPWSRSMFAGELAKPSSICLGAFDLDGDSGKLVGYLVVSRYVDAWHVMNIAVDPDHRGRGIATMVLERLFELTADDARRGYTLEVRVSNSHRSHTKPSCLTPRRAPPGQVASLNHAKSSQPVSDTGRCPDGAP